MTVHWTAPLATKTAWAGDSYVPFRFPKSCKVTLKRAKSCPEKLPYSFFGGPCLGFIADSPPLQIINAMNKIMKSFRTGMLASAVAAGASQPTTQATSFGDDAAFLKQHTPLVVLSDPSGQAKVALAPAWQGRVMTSTADGDGGMSFGWINRELISLGKLQPHINVFGGEERFWLGPEGGQFSIFFAKGAKFELSDWSTPAAIDTIPYEIAKQTKTSATFQAAFALTNYSGTRFDVKVNREVKLLNAKSAREMFGLKTVKGANVVAFESVNKITNSGREPWTKETGLLSVWILGMYNPSDATTMVVPIKSGPESKLGVRVTSDYFGSIPADRLAVKEDVLFFSGDGKFRSKIGVNPQRSKGVLGSYDAANKVLTLVKFSQSEGVTDYVNSLWKIQDKPFGGDALNSYNDGPASPGAKPLGPFYELESSSPAAALAPGKSLTHTHTTVHLSGSAETLNAAARTVLGVSLVEIQTALPKR